MMKRGDTPKMKNTILVAHEKGSKKTKSRSKRVVQITEGRMVFVLF
jgi:hypothetical protein